MFDSTYTLPLCMTVSRPLHIITTESNVSDNLNLKSYKYSLYVIKQQTANMNSRWVMDKWWPHRPRVACAGMHRRGRCVSVREPHSSASVFS